MRGADETGRGWQRLRVRWCGERARPRVAIQEPTSRVNGVESEDEMAALKVVDVF